MLLFDLTSWWMSLNGFERLFWSVGLFSNLLFIAYVIVQIFGHDTDADTNVDLDGGDFIFAALSLRSILAFGMFLGYTGVVAMRIGWSFPMAMVAGVLAGGTAAWMAYKLVRLLLRLQESGTMDIENAVGQTATVHLLVPAQSASPGKVMVEIQGALREMDAVSEEDAIPTGATVLVVGVSDEQYLIVQPFDLET
jgi:membrane protein implicated in regulation of membrane protease activity